MSSISHDDSAAGPESRNSYDNHLQRRSHNFNESHEMRSYSGHKDNSKFQNSSYSSPYNRSEDAQIYQSGSPNPDESADYVQEDSKLTKDNYHNMSELEAVPETSVEHSEVTNKLSHNLDSDIHRWKTEHDTAGSERNSREQSHFQRSGKSQHENSENNSKAQEFTVGERSGLANFVSPRFQMQSGEKRQNSTLGAKSDFDRFKDDYDRKLSHNNYTTLYNDTFNRKSFDHRTSGEKVTSGRESTHGRDSAFSDQSYPQKLRKYIEKDPYRNSPNSRKNMSAIDFVGDERGSERYSANRLNRTEAVLSPQRDESFQGHDYAEMMKIIQSERKRNEVLEEKVHKKEEMLKRMKKLQDELYQDFLETKNELERMSEEKDSLIQEVADQKVRNIKTGEKSKELEVRLRTLIDENNILAESTAQKDEIIGNLEDQLASIEERFDINSKKQEGKIENLTRMLNKYKREGRDSFNSRERGSVVEDEEKMILRKNLEEVSLQLKNLSRKNDDLIHENDVLRRQNHGSSGMRRTVNESSFPEKDMSAISHEDASHYKRKIMKLKALNENLRLELNSRPTIRSYKENEMKISSLENELEDVRNSRLEHRKTSEISFTSKLLKDVICELEIENIGDILPRIKEMQEHSKINEKFVESVLDLVERCSPKGYFGGRPTPKQAWKWIKRLMEEYMNIKKEGRESVVGSDQEILRVIMDYLMVDDVREVSIKLRNVLMESNLMKRVINKIKAIHNLERVPSLQDLERRLETLINVRTNGSESRPRHY